MVVEILLEGLWVLVLGLVSDVFNGLVCHFLLVCWLYPLLWERGCGTV